MFILQLIENSDGELGVPRGKHSYNVSENNKWGTGQLCSVLPFLFNKKVCELVCLLMKSF